jgi:hypothetical protein
MRSFSAHRHHFIAIAGYALLTVIFTFPLILNFSTHVMGAARLDNYEYVWKMGWVPHAIFNLGIDPMFAPHIYYPYGYPLAYGEITPIHTFGMMLITRAVGAVASYNLAAVISCVLSGWAVYALARRWVFRLPVHENVAFDARFRAVACFFAGAAFAFCAYRMQKLTGHLPLFDTHWLVLAIYMLDRWFEGKRAVHAILIGVFVGLAALSSWYYAFMLALLLPVFAIFRAESLVGLLRDKRTYTGGLLAVSATAALSVPFLIPYLQLNTAGETFVPADEAAFWAASITDYIVPNPLNPLWGSLVSRVIWPFPSPMITEFVISIGWVTILFAMPAFRGAKGTHWRAIKWMALVAFVLSLGPVLYLSRLPLGVPLPVALLREILPFADSIRSWGRFSIFVQLAFCVLAAAGMVITLEANAKRTRYIVAVGALLAMLFGAWQGVLKLTEVAPRAVDLWLAEQPDDSPIMEFPLSEALSGPAIYYTDHHGKPITFGYGTYLPLLYRERHPQIVEFPADSALDQLEAWGVRYVLITLPALSYDTSFTLEAVQAQPRLRPVTTQDQVAVYELVRDNSLSSPP